MTQPFAVTNVTVVTGDANRTLLPNHTLLVNTVGKVERLAPSANRVIPRATRPSIRPAT